MVCVGYRYGRLVDGQRGPRGAAHQQQRGLVCPRVGFVHQVDEEAQRLSTRRGSRVLGLACRLLLEHRIYGAWLEGGITEGGSGGDEVQGLSLSERGWEGSTSEVCCATTFRYVSHFILVRGVRVCLFSEL